jgi:hypothetical protein
MSRFKRKETREFDEMELLIDAAYHLEYCNYGDSWERECATEGKLPERIRSFLRKHKEK